MTQFPPPSSYSLLSSFPSATVGPRSSSALGQNIGTPISEVVHTKIQTSKPNNYFGGKYFYFCNFLQETKFVQRVKLLLVVQNKLLNYLKQPLISREKKVSCHSSNRNSNRKPYYYRDDTSVFLFFENRHTGKCY